MQRLLIEIEVVELAIDLLVKALHVAVVHDVVIGNGNRAAFFEVFDFRPVALVNFNRGHWALWAACKAGFSHVFWRHDGNHAHFAGKLMFKNFVFAPGVEAVEDNTVLAGANEVTYLFNDALYDEILAFALADFLAKDLLAFPGNVNAGFFHGFINNAAKVYLWIALFGKVVDRSAFAAARQADKRNDLNVFVVLHILTSVTDVAAWYDESMKKISRLPLEAIVAVLLPVVVYVTEWLTRGRSAPLYVAPPWDAPLPIFVIVAMLPFIYLVLAVGALSFGITRRKRAVAAAVGASFLTLALFDAVPLVSDQIGYPLAILLAWIAGGLTFYVVFRFLSRTKWLKTMSVLTMILGYALFIGVSIATLYYVRLSLSSVMLY